MAINNSDAVDKKFNITHNSLRQLFEQHFDPLCRFLACYTSDHMTIEDVVQDVFVNMWEKREELQIESPKTYLYSSARNRMLNYLREEKRQNTLLEQWVQSELEKKQGEECFNIDEFSRLAEIAIDNLPDKCRQIFNLSKKRNLTYKQIAGKLDISIKTVESQMGIALRKIREQLSVYYPLKQDTRWNN